MSRVAVFVDGANLFYTQRALGWGIDFVKLRDHFRRYGEIVINTYYIGEGAPPDTREAGFQTFLMNNGYSLETKTIKEIVDDETGDVTRKANLDIEIVLDMFNQIENYDIAILLSGDGDFLRALEFLKARGKRVFVYSTNRFAAREIKMAMGPSFIDLSSLQAEIERT